MRPERANDVVRTVPAACRICSGQCGMLFDLDQAGRIVGTRADRNNPVTRGYACIKGLTLADAHYSADRLLHPLKRQPDGSFQRIAAEQALDEIAARLRVIIDRDGADAVAGFRGTMNYTDSLACHALPGWIASIGSHSFFSTMTIDQSAKWITAERLGAWEAGKDPYALSDVLMVIGANPLVSLSTFTLDMQNPVKSLREAKARGVTLLVIDPRKTETAALADMLLQPLPGSDVALVAGMLRLILTQGWHDADFCAAHAEGLDALRAAVDPFTPDIVARRAGIAPEDMCAITEAFAAPLPDRRKRGAVSSGTGPNMAPHSNLAEHLVECLNVVCGRYARAGDPVPNPGVISPRWQRRAQAHSPKRSWESGWRDARGYGRIFGERMTATLPDAILSQDEGKVRALFVDGGNPVNAIAATDRTAAAIAALELLVVVDPFMTETARLADYILPPPMMLERPDIRSRDWEAFTLFTPYTQFSRPVIAPPAGSETLASWQVYWSLARRLGHVLSIDGMALDMETMPDERTLFEILLRNAACPAEAVMAATEGQLFSVEPMTVAPAGADAGQFALAPSDIVAELAEVAAEPVRPDALRLAVRRVRDIQNSMYRDLPELVRRMPDNPLAMHPADMRDRGIADGQAVRVSSTHGSIVVSRVVPDASLRAGVVTLTHGWGNGRGVNVNALTALDRAEPINAMPVLSGFDVQVEPVGSPN